MAENPIRRAGEDRPVTRAQGAASDLSLLNAFRAYKHEAGTARKTRLRKNRENRRAYLGLQDWTHKNAGQSQEFLPKTPVAVEQFVSFAKRALVGFGDYFDVNLNIGSESPLSGRSIVRLLSCHLDDMLVEDNKCSSFPVHASEALKVGSLESLMIFKVHGNLVNGNEFEIAEDGSLKRGDQKYWKLRVDLVAPESYYPDPSGAGLYEIHSEEKDLSYVVKRAKEGVFSQSVVNRIQEDFRMSEEERRKAVDKGQDESTPPSFRKKVLIDEFWGTILDNEGNVVHENCFMVIANDKYIIRGPIDNPFWHGSSPFVAIPIIRVPFSTWHKALFDHAAQINFAINEMYNLILDGGISAVWGIKQLRVDDLEDPKQVEGGIRQGSTLWVKNTLPHNGKVLETVTEGNVPPDSMAILEMLSREFAAASLSSELKMGSLPPKQVKATEVVELSQSQAVTSDGIIADIERGWTELLQKCWLTILQNMDQLPRDKIVEVLGTRAAMTLSRMTPEERYAAMGSKYSLEFYGLSEMMNRTRDFQKMMALMNTVMQVPMLAQAFFRKYSPDRVLASLMKMLQINPERLARDEREDMMMQQEFADMMLFAQQLGGSSPQSQVTNAETTGEPGLPAEIASVGNPTAGLAGAGQS